MTQEQTMGSYIKDKYKRMVDGGLRVYYCDSHAYKRGHIKENIVVTYKEL